MKIAVINFSGNVGKSTVARHLLLPRIAGAELLAVESVNADEGDGQSLRGRQFGELQEYLQTVDSAVVDIGASNVEDLLERMHLYEDSQHDFDCYVVPTVAALKQQRDTIATLVALAQLGLPAPRVRVVFNMVEPGVGVAEAFKPLLDFVERQPLAAANPACRLGMNEVYGRVRGDETLSTLAADPIDYKAAIIRAQDMQDKIALAHKLATRRLARTVLRELDACFAALDLVRTAEVTPLAEQRQ